MESAEKVEKRLDYLSQYVEQSLLFVETKHAAFIAMSLVFIIGLFEQFMTHPIEHCCMRLFGGLALLLLLIALIISLLAFYPIRKSRRYFEKVSDSDFKSIFRCENLAHLSVDELVKKLTEDIDDYELDVFDRERLESIIAVSKATARKYRLFRICLRLFFCFILLFLVLIVLMLF